MTKRADASSTRSSSTHRFSARRLRLAARAALATPHAALLAAILRALPAALLIGRAAAEELPDTGWIDRASLQKGEVQVDAEHVDRDRGAFEIKAAIRIAARPEAIWKILAQCDDAPQYVPNVVSCRSKEKIDDGRAELFEQTVKPAFFLPTFEHVYRLDYVPYTQIGVHHVSGPLDMDGNWWLLPQDDGSIVLLHELAVTPGLPVPRFFVRGTMKRDIPKILVAVRDRAEGRPSGDAERR
jgi:hypothetical protein